MKFDNIPMFCEGEEERLLEWLKDNSYKVYGFMVEKNGVRTNLHIFGNKEK